MSKNAGKYVPFVPFVKPGAKARSTATPRFLASVVRTATAKFVLHLPIAACNHLGLETGSKIRLFYDAEANMIAFKKSKNGDHELVARSANPQQLKTDISEFMMANQIAADPAVVFPIRSEIGNQRGYHTFGAVSASVAAEPRRRGRPPGPKNKPQETTAAEPRRRGRPPGSKNKPKVETAGV